MLILLCDNPLLLELLTEVCRYVFLSPGISSHVFDSPQAVAVHLDVMRMAPSLTPIVVLSGTLNCIKYYYNQYYINYAISYFSQHSMIIPVRR